MYTEVTYEILDHCLSIIQSIGPGCLIAKADIKDAFRIIPIHPEDYRLLGFTWRDHFYYDRCLPMGCSTSCQTLDLFTTSLLWILTSVLGGQHMSHILDDFIFITFHHAKHFMGPPISVSIAASGGSYCPVSNVLWYLAARGTTPGPLFCSVDLESATTSMFNGWLDRSLRHCSLASLSIKSHSFRIGAATHSASVGYRH